MRSKQTRKKKISHSRRALLKLTGTTLGAVMVPSSLAVAEKFNGPSPKTQGASQHNHKGNFFAPQQFKLVEELTETIIPADSHSGGAKAAKVAEYIDNLLLESLQEEAKALWREGLRLIEVMSQNQCGKSFLEASPKERNAVLEVLSENIEMTELPEVRFFKELKRLTVDGYYTSKIGILEELGYKGNTILEEFVGCEHSDHH